MDFNIMFDPEAAHIVLTAPWQRITMLSDASRSVLVTKAIVASIATSTTPLARYFVSYAQIGEPFWDEVTAAVTVDRTLVTKEVVVAMDVDTMPGMHYGNARIWSDRYAPAGAQHVHLVLAVDGARFVREFVSAARK
jgi:inosine-uridine nucleoside N-ribohydrolase